MNLEDAFRAIHIHGNETTKAHFCIMSLNCKSGLVNINDQYVLHYHKIVINTFWYFKRLFINVLVISLAC